MAAADDHPWGARRVLTRVTCPSTQDIVRDEALAGAPAGTIAVTEHQSAGRGRRGRTWEAPPGRALMFSYLIRPRRPAAELGPLALVVGIAVAERLPVPTRLRWPNDLVIGAGKTGGILVELVTPSEAAPFAIAGIGINANLMREELPPTDRLPATSLLVEGGVEVDRVALLESLLAGLDEAVARFDEKGFAPFLPRFDALDGLAGHAIALRRGDGEATGVARGVDAEGRLLLEDADGGVTAHAAGEVERVLD